MIFIVCLHCPDGKISQIKRLIRSIDQCFLPCNGLASVICFLYQIRCGVIIMIMCQKNIIYRKIITFSRKRIDVYDLAFRRHDPQARVP